MYTTGTDFIDTLTHNERREGGVGVGRGQGGGVPKYICYVS